MKKFLFPLSIILVGIFASGFVCFVLISDIKKNSAQFISSKKALANLEANFENQRDLEKLLRDREDGLETAKAGFIDIETPIHFFEFLEKNAEECSLVIEISSLSAQEIKGEDKILGLQMKLLGREDDFMKFLERIENSDYLIEIVSLTARGDSSEVSAVLGIKVLAE